MIEQDGSRWSDIAGAALDALEELVPKVNIGDLGTADQRDAYIDARNLVAWWGDYKADVLKRNGTGGY